MVCSGRLNTAKGGILHRALICHPKSNWQVAASVTGATHFFFSFLNTLIFAVTSQVGAFGVPWGREGCCARTARPVASMCEFYNCISASSIALQTKQRRYKMRSSETRKGRGRMGGALSRKHKRSSSQQRPPLYPPLRATQANRSQKKIITVFSTNAIRKKTKHDCISLSHPPASFCHPLLARLGAACCVSGEK